MRALIGPDVIRALKPRDVTIFDTRLVGFHIRCRASGTHSYRYTLGRGQFVTLGRVGDVEPVEARTAAEGLQSNVSRGTLERLGKDARLTARQARAETRQALKIKRLGRRLTWTTFLEQDEKLATGDMKSAGETMRRLREFGAWFGAETRLDAIDGFNVERWRASRRKDGVSLATIYRDLDTLRAALNWAMSMQYLTSNPAAGLKRAPLDANAPVRYLVDHEEQQLRDALTARDTRRRQDRERANAWRRERDYPLLPALGVYTNHLHPFVLLALNTGARRGELFNLTWKHIDFDRHLMTLHGGGTKNRQTRHVPLNSEAIRVLKTWKPANATPEAFVFPGEDGARLTSLKTAWTKLVKAIKLRARVHDLRHTFASRLVQNGVELAIVRELMGHSDIRVTQRYAHLQPKHRAAAVEKLVRA